VRVRATPHKGFLTVKGRPAGLARPEYELLRHGGKLLLRSRAPRHLGQDGRDVLFPLVLADGTSCRHQIAEGTGREAWHVARVLDSLL
jgi:hypothetical protein